MNLPTENDLSHIAPQLRALAVPLNSLVPDAANARIHDERNIDAIANSLRQFGQRTPLVCQLPNRIIRKGNGTFDAARRLGWTHIAALVVEEPDINAVAYSIADNRTSDLSSFDDEALASLLAIVNDSPEIDLEVTGFTDEEYRQLLEETMDDPATHETEIPEPPLNPVTRSGDLWILGDHRLLCGDSTKVEDVRRLMAGQRAVLFATDPPYLVGYDGTNHPQEWKDGDGNRDWSDSYGLTWDDADENSTLYFEFYRVAVAEAVEPDAAWYCWHASRRQAMVEQAWEQVGAFVHQQIIWVKDRPILTRSWYMWKHEPCFFGWVRPNKPRRTSDESVTGVWEIPTVRPGQSNEHPTSKPIEVFAIPMRQHTRRGDICYEPFSGSGSQHIAAEQLGRRCFGMEISPVYCDVIVRRWQQETGRDAVLDGTEKTWRQVWDERCVAPESETPA